MSKPFKKDKRRPKIASSLVLYPQKSSNNPYANYYVDSAEHATLALDHSSPISKNYDDFGKYPSLNYSTNYDYSSEIEYLREIVGFLYTKMHRWERMVPLLTDAKPVVLEEETSEIEISIEEAKPIIESHLRKCLKTKKKVYPSDVADALRINYATVREVFAILEKEGIIKETK